MGDVNYDTVKNLLSLKQRETDLLRESRRGKCLLKIGNQTHDISILFPEWFKTVKADA